MYFRTALIPVLLLLQFFRVDAQDSSACYNTQTCIDTFRSQYHACPGSYCGRNLDASGFAPTSSDNCMNCPRGTRTDSYVCVPCTDDMTAYGILYLLFWCGIFAWVQFYFITVTIPQVRIRVIMFLSILFETIISAILSLLCFSPTGTLSLHFCGSNSISDWYTWHNNPTTRSASASDPEGNIDTLHCSSEAVYPLWTFPMIFLGMSLITLLAIRLPLAVKYAHSWANRSIFFSLYFYPALFFVQALFGGVLCNIIFTVDYAFPYVLLIGWLVAEVFWFSIFKAESVNTYGRWIFWLSRYVWGAYGILSLIFYFDAELYYLAFAPTLPLLLPLLFFILVKTGKVNSEPVRKSGIDLPAG